MALMWASAPKCANCNKAFTSDFIDGAFTKSFRRGPLRIAMIQNLQEQETSLLPQTMDIITQRQRRKQAQTLQDRLVRTVDVLRYTPLQPLEPIFEAARAIQTELRDLSDVISGAHRDTKKARVVQERTIKCPNEACLGYSKRGQACTLCGTAVCKDCNCNVANSEALKAHVCKEDDKASWALIKEDSKACPKCGTPIQKVSGCNQMWCTVSGCNTAFDWATGHVINGRIHNPHYHEWLARNGTGTAGGPEGGPAGGGPNGPDLECAGPRDILSNAVARRIYDCLKGLPDRIGPDAKAVLQLKALTEEWVRALVESADDRQMRIQADEFGGYHQRTNAYGPDDHQDLRIEYLEGRLSKKAWATKLSTRETLRNKHDRVVRLHRMFQSAASDLVQRLVHDLEAAAAASGKSMQEQVFAGYDRDYRGTYTTRQFQSITDAGAAKRCLEPFFAACKSLSLYYMREKLKILSDYTDKRIMVLWQTSETPVRMTWTSVNLGSIVEHIRAAGADDCGADGGPIDLT